MVNNTSRVTPAPLATIGSLVRAYIALTGATLVTLVVLSLVDARLATGHAWVHAAIVVGFAVLLPLRLRAARDGRRSGLRAVGLIGATLLVVNVVEGLIPGLFPTWMRVEMFCVAALMASVVGLVVRVALATR